MSRFGNWTEDWARIPGDALDEAHPGHTCGVAYLQAADEVIILARANPAVHFFDREGRHLRSWGAPELQDAHGLTLVETGEDAPCLWLTDRGSGHAGKYDLSGNRMMTLDRPEHPRYAERPFKPTWVAVGPSTGEIWLADGYGAHLLHRYSPTGEFLETRDGTADEDLGKYACPHGIAFRQVNGEHQLYLTDRGAGRIRVYSVSGEFLRALEGVVSSPCAFAFREQWMAVPELKTGLKLFQGDDFVEEIGANPWAQAGWPDDKPADADAREPGRFLCPHDAVFGPEGELFVVELNDTGRIIRLSR